MGGGLPVSHLAAGAIGFVWVKGVFTAYPGRFSQMMKCKIVMLARGVHRMMAVW